MTLSPYRQLLLRLEQEPHTWLVTGVAGFIGSNLLEVLLRHNQRVIGLDNFATGFRRNLEEVQSLVTPEQWRNFSLIEGDIRNLEDCRRACEGVEYVLHQAALGSVPRSLNDPIASNNTNITGFLNMLVAAREAGVSSFTYAASSSTYGDHPALPKQEEVIGKPLSPYAVTKVVNELYAHVFRLCYDFPTIGLRYFNVFGARQNPNGAYAAVIPRWTLALLEGQTVSIYGDGETSRDFCYIANAVQANLLAATTTNPEARGLVYNVALGDRTSLRQLFGLIRDGLRDLGQDLQQAEPLFTDFRAGDVRHSQADISRARTLLGYEPEFRIGPGIAAALPWFVAKREQLVQG